MAKKKKTNNSEDLNMNTIVSRHFDKAARTLKLPEGLLAQIKACNAVYSVGSVVAWWAHAVSNIWIVESID